MNISFNYENSFLTNDDIEKIKSLTLESQKKLLNGTGEGNDYIGWVDYINNYDRDEFDRIKKAAARIISDSKSVIVIGIGGSYLGAKATIHALKGELYNEFTTNTPKIYFAGHNLNGEYLKNLITIIEKTDTSIIVISKSGTTTEPAVAFRILKEAMEKKYGDKTHQRIYAVTDKKRGALKTLSDANGYETFVVPDDVGGRYSVITPVGLLPMAVCGIDIDSFYEGLKSGYEEYTSTDFSQNICLKYAALRNILNRNGKAIEILVNYNPRLVYVSEWWKQLYGESEGKDGKGLFPVSLTFTTDLHSMGQFMQEGNKISFETTVIVEENEEDVIIPYDENDLDKLNYIAGKNVGYVNQKAFEGTLMAHTSGDVPNLVVGLPKINEFYLAKLYYFFMMSCGISGYILGVNPFNQPGVEKYKKNMFMLLGKSN